MENYVLFKVNESVYALKAEYVMGIKAYEDSTSVTGSADYIKGLITHLDYIVPVISLRTLFNLPVVADELRDFMDKRVQDHVEWVDALERTVRDGVPFTRTTNPNKCAFGVWYDSFETSNNSLSVHLKHIDAPHKAIHNIGAEILECLRAGEQEAAEIKLANMRNKEFTTTIRLLEEISNAYIEGQREIVIICQMDGNSVAFLVDEIIAIREMEATNKLPKSAGYIPYIPFLAEGDNKSMIQILDPQKLLKHYNMDLEFDN